MDQNICARKEFTAMKRVHHSAYVIELDKAVLKEKKFMDANSHAPLYVGMTGLPVEQRFQNHM